MSLHFFISMIILSMSFSAFSSEEDISAYRNPKIPFEYYEQLMHDLEKNSPDLDASAVGSARYYTGSRLRNPTSWSTIGSRFTGVRNSRHIKWSRRPSFLRRISWLYPNDGCYARAAMANRWFKGQGISTPGKVFAFGKLKVRTRNHPRGYVTWWYHVAPIVEVGGAKYVLDPAIESGGPLRLRDWLARMGTPSKIKVAICGSGAYSPSSSCSNETVGSAGVTSIQKFLGREWDQLKRMGRNPEALLGSNPPW